MSATDRGPARFDIKNGTTVLSWPVFDHLGIDVAVTTRHGGCSTGPYESLNLGLHVGDDVTRVVENRRRAAAALGADLDDLVVADQVHGSRAVVVVENDRGRGARTLDDAVAGCDALVTSSRGTVLTMLVADCVPVVLVDPAAGVVACVHAGWRGTVGGVLGAALATMEGLGGRSDRVVAGIGPAVAGARYQVGPEVATGLGACLPGSADGVLTDDGPGHWRADLVEANCRLLLAAGVPGHAIHRSGLTTGAPHPFFSDRAERPCGRFGLLVRLRPTSAPPHGA